MLEFIRLDSFDQVVDRYSKIKPLVSQRHPREADIRPLGNRRRKWERVEKVNNNRYILHDTLPTTWNSLHFQDYLDRPPIVWERKWGDDFVTVRPSCQEYDTTRYEFLRKFLPQGLYFDNQTTWGRHTISGIFIPRFRRKTLTDYHLTFRSGGPISWECITAPWPDMRPAVNKEKKAALRDDLEQFYDWMCSVGPILAVDNSEFLHRIRREVLENKEARRCMGHQESSLSNWVGPWQALRGKLATRIIKNYNHPLRMHLAVSFLQQEHINSIRTIEEKKKFRGRYNTWANDTFDLMVEKDISHVTGT